MATNNLFFPIDVKIYGQTLAVNYESATYREKSFTE